jgi:thiosulfate dehydrogenase
MKKKIFPWAAWTFLFYFAYSAVTTFYNEGIVEIEAAESNESLVLVDPEEAPPEIRALVMAGYRIFNNPQQYASAYAGDKVTCNNCHISGGNTLGGKGSGIPLVGVVFTYPEYSTRDGTTITLEQRINNCFMRSLNGKPLPIESEEMKACVAYLTWISSPFKDQKTFPWLGLPSLTTLHKADPIRGQQMYDLYCAECHHRDGTGGSWAPPIFGDASFNDGAGLNRLEKMASFLYQNMPYEQPDLAEEEALDIASFVIIQKRPHFIKQDK